MDVSEEIMRKQIMVSHFMNAVGCTSEQATKILQSAQWHPDVRSECLSAVCYRTTVTALAISNGVCFFSETDIFFLP